MVSVATQPLCPIKLLWPNSMSFGDRGSGGCFTMLGLGDIVIPEYFLSFAATYDHYQYSKSSPQAFVHNTYFYSPWRLHIRLATQLLSGMFLERPSQTVLYLRSVLWSVT